MKRLIVLLIATIIISSGSVSGTKTGDSVTDDIIDTVDIDKINKDNIKENYISENSENINFSVNRVELTNNTNITNLYLESEANGKQMPKLRIISYINTFEENKYAIITPIRSTNFKYPRHDTILSLIIILSMIYLYIRIDKNDEK